MSASPWGEPMRSKGLGWTLAGLGVVLVAAGLVLMLAIVPGMKKLPSDTDVTREYTGTMPVLFNPQTFQFMRNLPITLERHFAVVKTDGNVALVKEERTMASGGKTLEQIVEDYAVDRTTMMSSDKYPSDWAQTEGFWPRQGIVISWPIGSQKKDYLGWSDDYRSTVPLTYAGEMTYSRSGTKVYLYTSSSGPKPIAPAEVKAMGLPTELPKAKLTSLMGAAQMSPLVVQMLPKSPGHPGRQRTSGVHLRVLRQVLDRPDHGHHHRHLEARAAQGGPERGSCRQDATGHVARGRAGSPARARERLHLPGDRRLRAGRQEGRPGQGRQDQALRHHIALDRHRRGRRSAASGRLHRGAPAGCGVGEKNRRGARRCLALCPRPPHRQGGSLLRAPSARIFAGLARPADAARGPGAGEPADLTDGSDLRRTRVPQSAFLVCPADADRPWNTRLGWGRR